MSTETREVLISMALGTALALSALMFLLLGGR
jgi:hypothetical protein